MTVRTLTTRCALAVLSVASIVAVSGCSLLSSGPDDAKRDEASGEVTESADASVFSVKVGDCLNLAEVAEQTQVESLPVVPCAEPHDSEVYAEQTLTGDALPTDIDTTSDEFCYTEFSTFVGIAYEDSALDYQVLTPSAASWDSGDRAVQCIVVHLTEQITGTLQGAGI